MCMEAQASVVTGEGERERERERERCGGWRIWRCWVTMGVTL